jgi:hypothetical protein
MTRDFDGQDKGLPIEDILMVCATDQDLDTVRGWISLRYGGEVVPYVALQLELTKVHYWLLDNRRTPARDVIAGLAERGVIAADRIEGRLSCVYVPPQGVAKTRAALWN